MATWADGVEEDILSSQEDEAVEELIDDQEAAKAEIEASWNAAPIETAQETDTDGNRFEIIKKVRTYAVDHPTNAADMRAKFKRFNKGESDQSTLVSREPPLALEMGTVDQYERESRNEVKRMIHELSGTDVKVTDPHLAIIERKEQAKKMEALSNRRTAQPSAGGAAGTTWGESRRAATSVASPTKSSEVDYKSRVRVTNVTDDMLESELRMIFGNGNENAILNCYMPKDRDTGRVRGFAFITFRDPKMVDEAVRRGSVRFKNAVLDITRASDNRR